MAKTINIIDLCIIVMLQGVLCDNDTTVAEDANQKTLQPITLAVILPFEEPYLFRKSMVKPAIEYAVSTVVKELAYLGYRYEIAYSDSVCNVYRAHIAAREFYHGNNWVSKNQTNALYRGMKDNFMSNSTSRGRKRRQLSNTASSGMNFRPIRFYNSRRTPLVFLGPACNGAAEEVSALANSWNIPMITSGAPTMKIDTRWLPTLTRIGQTHHDLAIFILHIFRDLEYGKVYPIHLLYEEGWVSGTAEDECVSVIQTLSTSLPAFDRRFHVYAPKFISGNVNSDRFVRDLLDPRVVLICASSDVVRQLMISAYVNDDADPETNHWFVIDMHNRTHYARGSWKRGDGHDSIAKEAYKALKVITAYARRTRRDSKFNHFRQTMLRSYEREGINEDINEFVIGFHDAVILHKEALVTSLNHGVDVQNGTAFTKNMRNVLIQGIAGPLVMGKYGNRRGDYSILAMTDYKAGTFTSILDYLGTFGWQRGELSPLNSTKIAQQRNATTCFKQTIEGIVSINKEVDALAKSSDTADTVFGVLGAICGMTLCCLIVLVPICRKRRHRPRMTHTSENGTASGEYITGNSEQVSLHRPLRQEASVVTCMTTLDGDEDR